LQLELSDRIHEAEQSRLTQRHGWTVAETTGRLGFGGRIYRDPRFEALQLAGRDRQELAGARRRRLPGSGPDRAGAGGDDVGRDLDRRMAGSHLQRAWAGLAVPGAPRREQEFLAERAERGSGRR
jgi:hypothetical protein